MTSGYPLNDSDFSLSCRVIHAHPVRPSASPGNFFIQPCSFSATFLFCWPTGVRGLRKQPSGDDCLQDAYQGDENILQRWESCRYTDRRAVFGRGHTERSFMALPSFKLVMQCASAQMLPTRLHRTCLHTEPFFTTSTLAFISLFSFRP